MKVRVAPGFVSGATLTPQWRCQTILLQNKSAIRIWFQLLISQK